MTYFYKFDGTYYYNPSNAVLGPDSLPEVYQGFMDAVQLYGFENFKIVYAKDIIPYAYVIPTPQYGLEDWLPFQIVTIHDLDKICPGEYNFLVENDNLYAYESVVWRPKDIPSIDPLTEEYDNCDETCRNAHYKFWYDEPLPGILDYYWQLIPTTPDGQDILELAGGSELFKNSLY